MSFPIVGQSHHKLWLQILRMNYISKTISVHEFSTASIRNASKMKAWQIYQYGSIGELTLNKSTRVATIESPNEILVQVHAASVNPIDVRMIDGYGSALINILRKRRGIINIGTEFPLILGRDFSGTVVEVGKGVNRFKRGDEVWGAIRGERQGTHAEYTVCSQDEISPKPKNISHPEAASLPYVAATTWSAVATIGRLTEKNAKGKRVLILGGSGGIGTFCIQMLKAWGADVTVTCSRETFDLVTQLGADTAVDYKSHDIWQSLECLPRFDFILDTVRDHAPERALPLLSSWKNSVLVTLTPPLLGNADTYGVVPGLVRSVFSAGIQTLKGASAGTSIRWGVFQPNGPALHRIAGLVEQGKVKPVVHQLFPLSQVPDACQTVADGHLRGKVVIDMLKEED